MMSDLSLVYPKSAYAQERRLLPFNSTQLERDIVKIGQRITDLPTVEIKDFFDPDKCPSDLLGWLAAHETVDFWYEDWPDTKKRSIIRNIIQMKRLKGTLGGIERYLDYTDATVKKVVRPPARGFMRSTMTADEKLTWQSSLPKIRFYPYANRRIAPANRAFYKRGPGQVDRLFFYGDDTLPTAKRKYFMQKSYGPKLYGKKATYFDPLSGGPEIPCTYTAFNDPFNQQLIERVSITRKNIRRNFYGNGFYAPKFYMQGTKAASNFISVVLDPSAPSQYAMFAGYDTVTVQPFRVYGEHIPKSRSFCKKGLFNRTFLGVGPNRFLRSSYAPFMIYDQISLYDPARLQIKKRARSYYGHFQFGIKSYTAQLTIEIPQVRSKYVQGKYLSRSNFRKSANLEPLYRALDAVHIAKSERDKILVQPQTHEVVHFGSKLHLGSFRLGQIVSTI